MKAGSSRFAYKKIPTRLSVFFYSSTGRYGMNIATDAVAPIYFEVMMKNI